MSKFIYICLLLGLSILPVFGQNERKVSGVIITAKFERVADVEIVIESNDSSVTTRSVLEGKFSATIPDGALRIKVFGKNIEERTFSYSAAENTENLSLRINFTVPPIVESVTIENDSLEPAIETRNSAIFSKTLFVYRDDQLIFTLNAGINAAAA
ncbi:MAG: hypothetical protein R2681_12810 [Pyrinomonadaceae bacterium]